MSVMIDPMAISLMTIWHDSTWLSFGTASGLPLRPFDPVDTAAVSLVRICPLEDGWIALRSVLHDGCVAADPKGQIVTVRVTDDELRSTADLNRFGFRMKPAGDLFVLEMHSGQHLTADGAGGFVVSENGPPTVFGIDIKEIPADEYTHLIDGNCGGVHAGGHVGPLWEDENHKRLVESAFNIIALHPTLHGSRRPLNMYGNAIFKEAVFKGLHDADYLAPYTDGITPYKSHFYDPDTGVNYMGETEPTARTQASIFAGIALNHVAIIEDGAAPRDILDLAYKRAGFYLGVALHYVTDMSQPMHTANFINNPFIGVDGDYRHAGFEEHTDKIGAGFLLRNDRFSADDIDPEKLGYGNIRDLVKGLAEKVKVHYKQQVAALVETKARIVPDDPPVIVFSRVYTDAECAPVLAAVLPLGQQFAAAFLIAWGRRPSLGANQGEFPNLRSSWPPVMFKYKDEIWIGASDSDDGRKVKVIKLDQIDKWPSGAITVGGSTAPALTDEAPAIAGGDDTLIVAYHGRGNKDLNTYRLEGELSAAAKWIHYKVENAEIKNWSNPAIARLGDELVMVWADYGGGMTGSGDRSGLYAMYYNMKGGKWSALAQLPNRSTNRSPALAVYGDQLIMAWAGVHNYEPIFTASLAKGSRTWSAQARLADDTKTDRGPALAVRGGMIYLLWRWGEKISYATAYQYNSFASANPLGVGEHWSKEDVQAYADYQRFYVIWSHDWKGKYAKLEVHEPG